MENAELVARPQEKGLIFNATNPGGILNQASEVAKTLAPMIEKQKLFMTIRGRKHVYTEGWTSMIAMLGVFPCIEYTKRLERKDEIAYEARVRLRHISGIEIGAGEALCSSKESNWHGRDEYAIKSMAQTRAVGKACRLSFSWIMALSGFDATPLEEMDSSVSKKSTKTVDMPVVDRAKGKNSIDPLGEAGAQAISEKQRNFFWAKTKELGIPDDVLRKIVKARRGEESTQGMNADEMDMILQACQDWKEAQNG